MSLIKLIKEWKIIEDISKNFDVVLSDFDFKNKKIKLLDGSFEETISCYVAKNQKILLILDHLLLESIFHIIGNVSNIFIIDMHTGIYEKWNKLKESVFDVTALFSLDFDIYEPSDIKFIEILLNKGEGKNLVRINSNETTMENHIGLKDVNFLKDQGYDWTISTLLVSGNYWIELIKGIESNEKLHKSFGVFVINKLNFILTEELINNINITKNIFVIVDIKNMKLYKNYIKSLLYDNKLYDITINFIIPNYDNLTTIIDEYRLEEVSFDAKGIMDKILN